MKGESLACFLGALYCNPASASHVSVIKPVGKYWSTDLENRSLPLYMTSLRESGHRQLDCSRTAAKEL